MATPGITWSKKAPGLDYFFMNGLICTTTRAASVWWDIYRVEWGTWFDGLESLGLVSSNNF
jgi:hypothetical protein